MTAASVHLQRKLLPYAVACVALATLGACTGSDPGPAITAPPATSSATPSTTTSPPATTKPTPTATVDPVIAKIPAAARPKTETAAQTFSRFFFDSLNRSAVRADPSILEGLFTSSCKTCVAMQNSISELRKRGRHHAGPTIRIVNVSTSSFVEEKRVILVDVDQSAVDVLDADGKKVDRTLAAKGTFAASLEFSKGRWIVSRLQTVASPS
ncbi:MAG: hypothetical protein HOQ27_04975 [Dermatophilaceae bacterium]|nr:hypothetical protein [Dermatophilaceae bacterium]